LHEETPAALRARVSDQQAFTRIQPGAKPAATQSRFSIKLKRFDAQRLASQFRLRGPAASMQFFLIDP